MATLTFVAPDGSESQFDLAKELSVGRESGNNVVLAEGGLSRKHCRFIVKAGQVLLEDLGSSNGSFVDGERIGEPTPVKEGQEILLANVKVVLASKPARPASGPRPAPKKPLGSSAKTGQVPRVASSPPRKASPNGEAVRNGSGAARPVSNGRNLPARKGAEPPAPAADPAQRAILKGMTGPWAGREYPLLKMVNVVGRVDGNDLVVEDDSVSRRHAELRKSGPGFVVRDMESANGTFINGERISEAPLRPKDILKFGVIEFTYQGPAVPKTPSPVKDKKKLLIYGGSGIGGLVVLGAIIYTLLPVTSQHKVDIPMQGASAAAQTEDVGTLLGMCKSFSDPDGNTLDWDRAVKECNGVLKQDPINTDARRLKKLSEFEQAQKKIFEKAHNLFQLGQEDEAMETYMQIDSKSHYYSQGRSEFRKSAQAAMTTHGDTCSQEWRANLFDKAWVDCKKYADVACYLGYVDKYKRPFDEVKSHMKGKDDWSCPEIYARFLKDVGGLDPIAEKRSLAIKAKYTDPDLGAAVERYSVDQFQGLNAIQRYKQKGGKELALAKQLFQFMEVAFSKHQTGEPKLLQSDLKGAAQEYRDAIEADGKIIPGGFQSDAITAMRTEISSKFAEKGRFLYTESRFPESFMQCEQGWEFSHSNPDILTCYSDLETQAAKDVEQGDCSAVLEAIKITRADNVYHKQAEKKKADQACQ